MAVICPACAEPNREGARFCDHCATSLDSGSAAGPPDRTIELRQATVVFCDVVQSTRLANSLPPDVFSEVLQEYREIVADVARCHAGHLIDFNGDGAFMLFGYPKAREDAAESALHFGLALVQSVRQANPGGEALDLRVGIASGTVVTGELEKEAATHRESVVGSVVHLAARLVAQAQPGCVVIDEATRRWAGRFFEYRDLGRLLLKGFDEGVQAWLVLQASSIASRFEAAHPDHGLPAMVGREEPLTRLEACWARALTGDGTTVILAGDAGMGKSRLARDVRRRALEHGAMVLDIDCSPRTANTPLGPVGTMLRRLSGAAPQDAVAALAHARAWVSGGHLGTDNADAALPYVAPLLGIATPQAGALESPDRFRQRMIAVLVDIVRALASRQPLFILCEDAHWSDATTMELVTRVGTEVTGLPLLVVATTRAGQDEGGPVEIPGAITISLAPLDASQSTELVRQAAPEGTLSAATIEQIVTRCVGNPLYLEETTRSVVEAARESVGDRVVAPALRNVPTSLQGQVQARLDRWPAVKPVIQAASVVGRDLSLPLLEMLLPERSDVPRVVALLVDRELLVRDGDKPSGTIRFKHALIHDAVYQTLVRSERQRLHSRTADVLAQYFAGRAESAPDVLAHHLAAARRHQEATSALAEASDLAAARAAHVESIAHSRAALSIADHITDDRMRRHLQRRVLTRLGLGLAAIEGYASPDVLKTYHQARDLCATQDDPAELFPIIRGLGTFYFVRGDMLEADRLSEQCLDLSRRSGRADLLIEALSFRGYPTHYRGNLHECRQTLEECLAVYGAERGERFMYPSAQDAGTAARSLLLTTMWLQGDTAGIDTCAADLLGHVTRLQRPFDEAYARVWMAGLCHLQRRLDEALDHATIGIAISQKYGFNTWLVASVMMASMATALRDGAPESIETLRNTHRAFMQAGANASASFYLWGLARALVARGDRQPAREALSEAVRLADLSGETYMNAELLILESALETSEAAAHERLWRAIRLAEDQGAVTVALRAAAALLERRGALQSLDHARTREAMAALNGEAPYPSEPDWASSALQTVKAALVAASPARA